MKILDLSHQITNDPACSFQVRDNHLKLSFLEDDPNGCFFINTQIDNLLMNFNTHIHFPGTITSHDTQIHKPIGCYPVDTFIGKVIVLDCSSKIISIKKYFDENGKSKLNLFDENNCYQFLLDLDKLQITENDFEEMILKHNLSMKDVKGVLFYTGLSNFWKNIKFESWEYIYFLSIHLSESLREKLVAEKISFVGVDSFQLGHPVINYNGQERPFTLYQSCQNHIKEKIYKLKMENDKYKLLAKNILIYECLNIPKTIINQKIDFFGVPLNINIEGFNNTSIVRPFIML